MPFKKLKISYKLIIFILCAGMVLFSFVISSRAFQFTKENFAVINKQKIFLEIADTPEKRAKGLMFIEKMPENFGMIFLFNKAEPRSFWMKNVKIPLDIVFINKNTVVDIHKNIPVNTDTKQEIYKTTRKADCVIEINAGFCDKYNVKPGDGVILSRNIRYMMKMIKIKN